ncbi:hypothetical protein ACWFMI_23670 [Nocardiopsis terrae]|uniref:hypothetical protein n=1 Tax=Streptomyces sp. NPDC057554 TaxID=3350538 RepID=UPI0036CB45D6
MKISDEVLAVLEEATTDGRWLRLPRQLDRHLYEQVDRVLRAAGGAWIGGRPDTNGHHFPRPAEQVLEQLRTGEYVTPKEKGFVPTPPELAEQMVAHLDVGPGDRVLEPSAGDGAIIQALASTRASVDAVEDDRDHEQALTRLQLEGLAHTVWWGDFLALTPPGAGTLFDLEDRPLYDAVAANPPFGHQARHLLHALSWLRPGGQLVAIASAGIRWHEDKDTRELRARLEEYGARIESLPTDAFADSGVGVRTVLITLTTPEQ